MKAAAIRKNYNGELEAQVVDFFHQRTLRMKFKDFDNKQFIEIQLPKREPDPTYPYGFAMTFDTPQLDLHDKLGNKLPMYGMIVNVDIESMYLHQEFAELGYGYSFNNGPIEWLKLPSKCECGSLKLGHPGHDWFCPLDTRGKPGACYGK